MCLITNKKFPNVALKKIKAYKILIGADGHLYSPFRFKMTEPCGRIVAESKRITSDKKIFSFECGAVGEGYVFAYANIIDARLFALKMGLNADEYSVHLFECEIPKGTLFFVDDNNIQICAKKMDIIKEIEI